MDSFHRNLAASFLHCVNGPFFKQIFLLWGKKSFFGTIAGLDFFFNFKAANFPFLLKIQIHFKEKINKYSLNRYSKCGMIINVSWPIL